MQMVVLVLVVCLEACLTWVVLAACQTWAALVVPLLRRLTKQSILPLATLVQQWCTTLQYVKQSTKSS